MSQCSEGQFQIFQISAILLLNILALSTNYLHTGYIGHMDTVEMVDIGDLVTLNMVDIDIY